MGQQEESETENQLVNDTHPSQSNSLKAPARKSACRWISRGGNQESIKWNSTSRSNRLNDRINLLLNISSWIKHIPRSWPGNPFDKCRAESVRRDRLGQILPQLGTRGEALAFCHQPYHRATHQKSKEFMH